MFLTATKSRLDGSVKIPGSKSHTIRALILATLAKGKSLIVDPLDSLDTRAALEACRRFGAVIDTSDPVRWSVEGLDGVPSVPDDVVDVKNSGTTLYVMLATAALCRGGRTVFTGDAQIRRRPAGPIVKSLNDLGAEVVATRGNDMCPIVVKGPLSGGQTLVKGITSQYVSAILLNAPFASGDTVMDVEPVNEKPYIQMTLDWMDTVGLQCEVSENFSHYQIKGGQRIAAFERKVAADFSSATFFLVAGAALDARLELRGLDMNDTQGDKAVVHYLTEMGADISIDSESISVNNKGLKGCELDLNATPDALPAMAVAAALAEGETRLVNVAHARLKETDRIAVMHEELTKMGVECKELDDGLIIQGRGAAGLKASQTLSGHDDHRIVMALSIAAMAAEGRSLISTAEAMSVTFPEYVDFMRSLGAEIELTEEE